ncbi:MULTISPECIES: ATP-binding protein [unclassified Marinovum]
MERSALTQRIGIALLLGLAVASALAVVMLAGQVARDLRLLSTANSDNVQWSIAQSEVEFLKFLATLDAAATTDPPAPEQVRRAFDIFYSRIDTLENGRIYIDLRRTPEFSGVLTTVRDFLDGHAPVIDANDPDLVSAVPALLRASRGLADNVRSLSTIGLTQFARISDARRDTISWTLLRLAIVTVAMVTALCVLSLYSNRVRKRALRQGRALGETNARLNAVLSASIDGVILTDAYGCIIEMNAAAEDIFGYRLMDVRGKTVGELIVPHALREAHETGMQRARNTGVHRLLGSGRVRLEARRADGSNFPVEVVLREIQSNEAPLFIGFLRDISANVTAERDLTEARDRALAGEKAKEQFLAVMSHEIRTPLNGILGNIALLQDSTLETDQARYVRNMDISGQVLMDHVDAVLDLTRFATGNISLNDEPLQVEQLLQDIVDGQESRAMEQGNKLSWTWIGPPVEWIRSDKSALQQILLNLVSNALKFTHIGEVSVEAEYHRRAKSDGSGEMELRVIDSGTGIAPEDLPHVFDDFRTTDPSFGRKTGGTGLGLGIAYRLVKAMQGEIGVESTPGEGSVFWVRFPAPPSAAPPKPRPAIVPKEAAETLRILVVEDNQINLELTRDMLRGMGHKVDVARNGQLGVKMATAQRFDLILMDIAMPKMDGIEATAAIRSSEGASATVPIVALSANVLPQDRRRFLAAGMQHALTKPLMKKSLVELLANIGLLSSVPLVNEDPVEIPPDLRRRFLTEMNALVAWLATSKPDPAEVDYRCHQAAGTAAVFGETDLHAALIAMQGRAKNDPDAGTWTNAIARLTQVIESLDGTEAAAAK